MPREILVDWTTPSGGGKVSVFYFDENSGVTDQRARMAMMFAGIQGALTPATTWRIRNEGREVDEATGTLTGAWSDAPVHAGAGTVTGEQPVADATQALIRWSTDVIVGGRFLRGRTYIPGLSNGNLINGNVSAGVQTAFTEAADNLVNNISPMLIWHRPTNGAGGSAHPVTAASVWSELAVLRRRRG